MNAPEHEQRRDQPVLVTAADLAESMRTRGLRVFGERMNRVDPDEIASEIIGDFEQHEPCVPWKMPTALLPLEQAARAAFREGAGDEDGWRRAVEAVLRAVSGPGAAQRWHGSVRLTWSDSCLFLECFPDGPEHPGEVIRTVGAGDSWAELLAAVALHQAEHGCAGVREGETPAS